MLYNINDLPQIFKKFMVWLMTVTFNFLSYDHFSSKQVVIKQYLSCILYAYKIVNFYDMSQQLLYLYYVGERKRFEAIILVAICTILTYNVLEQCNFIYKKCLTHSSTVPIWYKNEEERIEIVNKNIISASHASDTKYMSCVLSSNDQYLSLSCLYRVFS